MLLLVEIHTRVWIVLIRITFKLMSKKIKKADRYFLVPTDMVVSEGGISMYSLLREGDFSRDVTQKYHNDVKDILYSKLDNMIKGHGVPERSIKRVKALVDELILTTEILVTYDLENPEIQKIIEKRNARILE
jgi:hypothetical protein